MALTALLDILAVLHFPSILSVRGVFRDGSLAAADTLSGHTIVQGITLVLPAQSWLEAPSMHVRKAYLL